MALNRSPEFKSSNLKPSAAELFGILRPPYEQTQKSSTIQASTPNFKHLNQVVLKQLFFHIRLRISMRQTPDILNPLTLI